MSKIGIRHAPPFSLLAAEEVQAAPGQSFMRSHYEFFTAELVLEGAGWLSVGGRYYDVEEGDVYILPPGLDHEYAADRQRPWRKLFFNAGGSLAEALIGCYGLKTFYLPAWRKPEIFHRMRQLYEGSDTDVREEAAVLLHRLIAAAAGGAQSSYSDAVAAALEFIEANLQRRIGLAEIAAAAFLSPSQASRLFRKETGYTPCAYLGRRRIERAMQLLRGTDLRVGDIAARLQFADAFYFSNAFRKAVGCSPTQYRAG